MLCPERRESSCSAFSLRRRGFGLVCFGMVREVCGNLEEGVVGSEFFMPVCIHAMALRV